MKSVVIRLEGPLQAWSTQSKLGVRDTDREPSKSGVLGMVGAAIGMPRDDDDTLADLRELAMALRVDRPGSLLRDYQTAGGRTFRGKPYAVDGTKGSVTTERYYLQGASFVAALAGDDALVDRIAEALLAPRWPIFLGRRSCPPSVPPLMGVVGAGAEDAAREAALAEAYDPAALRLVLETTPADGGEPRFDVPLSFRPDDKRYGVRYVRSERITPPVVDALPAAQADAGSGS